MSFARNGCFVRALCYLVASEVAYGNLPLPSPPPSPTPPITTPVPAPSVPLVTPPDPLVITITSASGAQRHPLSFGGHVDRVGLKPAQIVSITLHLPAPLVSAVNAVVATSLDGGGVTTPVTTSPDLTSVQFAYRAARSHGRHRLLVQVGPSTYEFEFYVVQLDAYGSPTANNPVRVRTID